MYDVKDIRDALIREIATAPAGGVFHDAQSEASRRNSFSLRLEPTGPIFTVTVTVGGAITGIK
jgi:hypothetical protein